MFPILLKICADQGVLNNHTDVKQVLNSVFSSGNQTISLDAKRYLTEEIGTIHAKILEIIGKNDGETEGNIINNVVKAIKDINHEKARKILQDLEHKYGIIKKLHPIHTTKDKQHPSFRIVDEFMLLYEKFIRDRNTSTNEQFNLTLTINNDDLNKRIPEIEGATLENWVKQIITERSYKTRSVFQLDERLINITNVKIYDGTWKGFNGVEIDIICTSDDEKIIFFGSIKRKSSNLDINNLRAHVDEFKRQCTSYKWKDWKEVLVLVSADNNIEMSNRYRNENIIYYSLINLLHGL